MNVNAIICAAGKSERFAPGTSKNKIEQPLGERPVFMRAMEVLANRKEISCVILSVDPDTIDDFRGRWGDAVSIRGGMIVPGGRTARWETVRNALSHLSDDCTHIAIHDAARPCLSEAVLDRLFEAAKLFDAVIPGVAVADTLKRVSEATESALEDDPIAAAILGDAGAGQNIARRVIETVPRERLYAIQTPQVFERGLIIRAYAQDQLDSTDDAMLIERLGEPVRIIEGDPLNIKITTETDLRLAHAILGVRPERDRPAHLRF